ncbi:MAG: hypothetical protein ACLR7Z_18200 [Bilophila wadsworthia]
MTVPPSLRRAGRILGWSLLGLVLVLFCPAGAWRFCAPSQSAGSRIRLFPF